MLIFHYWVAIGGHDNNADGKVRCEGKGKESKGEMESKALSQIAQLNAAQDVRCFVLIYSRKYFNFMLCLGYKNESKGDPMEKAIRRRRWIIH